mmetsp:Transcript_2271/g.4202  ORF Transcript_2271/g.4202 Transcript_2271/m.4202 type:complete len:640 (-) Transcript_2271:68-1987(-)
MKNDVHDGNRRGAEIMESRVPSLKSGLTWGTADDTVLMNNKARTSAVYKSENGGNMKAGTSSIDRGEKVQEVVPQQQGKHVASAVKKSKMNRSISHGSHSSNTAGNVTNQMETDNDGSVSSLFNFIFCLGDEGAVFEEDTSSGGIMPSKAYPDSKSNKRAINKNAKTNHHLIATNNTNTSSKESDAYILEMALQESRNQGSLRRKHKQQDPRYVASSDKLGSLDIVMELQQQENQSTRNNNTNTTRSKSNNMSGNSPRSPRKTKGSPVLNENENHTTPAAMDEQSVITDIFDFGSFDTGILASTNDSSTKGLWIQGPAIGTFQNISTEANAFHPEVANTYVSFRCDKKSVALVISRLTCSVPLYHHKFGMERDGNEINVSISSSHSGTADNEGTKLDVSSKIINVCSEPVSKIFEVRGPTYPLNGKKIPSDESIFALLGADNIIKKKNDPNYMDRDVCKSPESYFVRLRAASERLGLITPFLLVVNFVVPWGNIVGYFYRPDGEHGRPYNSSRQNIQSEKLWDTFIVGDDMYRNSVLKFIPRVVEGPWALKKLVGTQPAMIGQKVPTSYFGSLDDGYLEICIDVTKGGKMANNICSAVSSKASLVSIDLAFLLQGDSTQKLPEQLLSVMRLHHVRLKND